MISPDTAVRLLSLAGLVEEAPLAVGDSEKFTILGMFASVSKEEKETIFCLDLQFQRSMAYHWMIHPT